MCRRYYGWLLVPLLGILVLMCVGVMMLACKLCFAGGSYVGDPSQQYVGHVGDVFWGDCLCLCRSIE